MLKDWLPIVLSTLALCVSALAWWDQHEGAKLRLNLRAQVIDHYPGCAGIELYVTNQSNRAITLAPPFVADLRPVPKPKTERESLLRPPPFVAQLRATTRGSIEGPLFLRPQEALTFGHRITPKEQRLLKADSQLVVAVTDYPGHFWSASVPALDGSEVEGLKELRRPCAA